MTSVLLRFLRSSEVSKFSRLFFVSRRCFSIVRKPVKKVNVTFIDRNDEEIKVKAFVGDSLLEVAHANDVDLEGACEGTVACSTCHLIISEKHYDKIDEPPSEEELDMLDLAFGLTDTSRLGCQVIVTEQLENLTATVPKEHRDMRSD